MLVGLKTIMKRLFNRGVVVFIFLSVFATLSGLGRGVHADNWRNDLVESVPNPVFTPAGAPAVRAYYPSILYDSQGFGDPSQNVFYKMWYSDGIDSILFATSADGKTWVERGACVGLTNPHHVDVMYDANGFGGGPAAPLYRIWYYNMYGDIYNINILRTAKSFDGINWIDEQALTQDPLMPIVDGSGSNWDRGSYGPIHLFYQPDAPNSGPSPFDYTYVMYYDATTGAFEQGGLGYSTDGVMWTRYGDDPVLPSGSSWEGPWGNLVPWDSSYVGFGTVIRDKFGMFHWWYSGGATLMGEGIGYAFSADGINWIRSDSNPFITLEAGTWHSRRAYTPAVLYDVDRFSGHGDNSEFKMWYSGRSDSNVYAIGYLGVTVATVDMALGPNNPSSSAVTSVGDPVVLMQVALSNDDVEDVTLNGLDVTLSGSAVTEGNIDSLRLYHDSDGDGKIGPGDVLLAEEDVVSAVVTFAAFSDDLSMSSTTYWLIAAVFPKDITQDEIVSVGIEVSADVVGSGDDTHEMAVDLSSEPLNGNPITFRKTLRVIYAAPGPNNPGPGVFDLASGVDPVLLQMELVNDTTDDLLLTGLRVTLDGTAVALGGINALSVYVDVDGDGQVGPDDEFVATGLVLGSLVYIHPFSVQLDTMSTEYWLIVAEPSESAAEGQVVRASIASSSDLEGEIIFKALVEPNIVITQPIDGNPIVFVNSRNAYAFVGGCALSNAISGRTEKVSLFAVAILLVLPVVFRRFVQLILTRR